MDILRTLYRIMPVVMGLAVLALFVGGLFDNGAGLAARLWLLLVCLALWGLTTARGHVDGRLPNGTAKPLESVNWIGYVFSLLGMNLVAISYLHTTGNVAMLEWAPGIWFVGLFYSALLSPYIERRLFGVRTQPA